jgi:hypothetical protein
MLPGDGGRSSRPFIHDPAAYAVLAESFGVTPAALERELTGRGSFLESLAERGICDPPSVAAAVRAYWPDLPAAR